MYNILLYLFLLNLASSYEDVADSGLSGLYEITQIQQTALIVGWVIAGSVISGAVIFCGFKITYFDKINVYMQSKNIFQKFQIVQHVI